MSSPNCASAEENCVGQPVSPRGRRRWARQREQRHPINPWEEDETCAVGNLPIFERVLGGILIARCAEISADDNRGWAGIECLTAHLRNDRLQHEEARGASGPAACIRFELLDELTARRIDDRNRTEIRLQRAHQVDVFAGSGDAVTGRDGQHGIGRGCIDRKRESFDDTRRDGLTERCEQSRAIGLFVAERRRGQRAPGEAIEATAPTGGYLLQQRGLDAQQAFAGSGIRDLSGRHLVSSRVLLAQNGGGAVKSTNVGELRRRM